MAHNTFNKKSKLLKFPLLIFFLLVLLLSPNIFSVFAAEDPLVKTQAGLVKGFVENDIYVFKGVRYGADTATTRFQAPIPPEPWTDIADALDFGNQTPQINRPAPSIFTSWANRNPDSEDCLFLNVWTPGINDGKKRPVMVWFHGGGFSAGSGASNAYDGVRLAKRGDVVVVTVNHRLNIFGHLYLAEIGGEKFADSGNVGILDLILSLKWVRDNITAFGGNPENVMIFGESGGGAKVTTLMAMPEAKGLFHRATVQSGAWLMFITPEEATNNAKKIISELGLTEKTLDQITSLPMEKIKAAYVKSMVSRAVTNYGPVIDSKNLKRHPFTPDAPPESVDVPLLIGFNRTESTLLGGAQDPSTFKLTWETLPDKLAKHIPGIDVTPIIAKYQKRYPEYTASDIFFTATTDAKFLRAHTAQAERKAAQNGAPVYFYMLNWNTPVEGGIWRSPHALEIGFVFDNVAKSESMSGVGEEQQRLADLMSTAWIAFARTGNPNNDMLPPWPAYDGDKRATMVFDLEPSVVNDIHGPERRLFDSIKMGPNG